MEDKNMNEQFQKEAEKFAEARQNFIEAYFAEIDPDVPVDKTLLLKTIPDIAATLLKDEFGINFHTDNLLVITFITGWKHILKFIDSQPDKEFAVDVAGMRVGYNTQYHDNDKPSNIVPIVAYTKTPVFVKQHQSPVSGADYQNDMLQKYNAWRSVNLEEVIDKIERDTHYEVLNDYGIDLGHPQVVMPIIGAFYATGLQIAKDNENEVLNMYNIYTLKYKQGHFFAKELGYIKQNLKGDGKNNRKGE